MIKQKINLLDIKNSNLVFLVEKTVDLNLISELKLWKKIIDKIKSVIKKGENKVLDFYIWSDNYEKIYILFYNKETNKDVNYFLWAEFPKLPSNLTILTNSEQNVEVLLNNCLLSRYKYQEYKTEKKEDKIFFISNKETKKIINNRISVIENIILARDLWNKPANTLYPEEFAKIVKNTKFKNTKVKIFDFKKIEKLWLSLLQCVWKWSSKKPRMVILERFIDKKYPTIWIVWKGITFDTWWIQVKPGDHMYEMKWDMCWAATTFATMKELDKSDLKVNIIACLVLAENHISGESYKPSDIIKSYSWKTVDIIHTDAEWRLVLADGISYISKNYKLDSVVSIATLTWACLVALWHRYAWIMWDDEKIISKIIDYSKTNIEKYNRLPFDEYFIEKTKSEIADLANLNRNLHAWSTMWAAFLSNFLLNNEKYTHIDIAWTAINGYESYAYVNKWMTWFWVDSLSSIIKNLK